MTRRPFARSARALPQSLGGSSGFVDAGVELRCGCHRLLARAVLEGIEFRCARCKENTVLPWEQVRALEAQIRS